MLMSVVSQLLNDHFPAKAAMRLRAVKNRRDLFGLYAPAELLTGLVPNGSIAVDAGAAHGLYAYFIAKRASVVHAFEPNPHMFARLDAGAGRKIVTHAVALSDRTGLATLHVPPAGFGEASLHQHPERGDELMTVEVETRTLDSFRLHGVGLLKADVEGHEMSLLRGGETTLRACMPTLFLELEERHTPGILGETRAFLKGLGYRSEHYLQHGRMRPMNEFDLERDQLAKSDEPSSPDYACNFLFRR